MEEAELPRSNRSNMAGRMPSMVISGALPRLLSFVSPYTVALDTRRRVGGKPAFFMCGAGGWERRSWIWKTRG
ncbi:hypothetical protein E2562_019647 [Oryza meyeriana var. granulata]|uniref:Uncharacterized protein n=1 Tax=Oryza meyeriana var. granulata TaxID=110450 RepID=A0A6G1C8P1_9ORYZ|nr:hypothetical protein E2562_019647 [Oryza meyeriana var. granulata]